MAKPVQWLRGPSDPHERNNMDLLLPDIAFCGAVGFLVGVFELSLGWSIIPTIVLGVLVSAIGSVVFDGFAKHRVKVLAIFSAVALVSLSCGVFYCRFFLSVQQSGIHLPSGKSATFSAIVIDEPQISTKSIILKVALEKPYAGNMMILAPFDSNFGYGDELKISGGISRPATPGEQPAVFASSISLLFHHKAFWLREELINLKLAIIGKYNMFLPEEQAMLLGGIAFGAKQNFKPDLKAALAASGTTHLVAISGYNITIIAVAAEQIFGGFLSRRKKLYATLVLIILFVLMTGLQSSAIRAAIMGFLALAAKDLGRSFSIRNAMAFTAVSMALFDPTILTQNVAFELSFLSLLGIVYLSEPIKKLFPSDSDGVLGWKESARTTLCAQLGTMPVLIATFGQSSATSVGANVLVLGTVPLTMFLGVALAILGFVAYYPAWIVARMTGLLLGYQLGIIRFFASLALPLPFQFNSVFVFVFYYAALGTFAYYYGEH
jgi:competence protein ComEC